MKSNLYIVVLWWYIYNKPMSSRICQFFSLRVAATNSDEAVPVARFPYIDNLILRLAGYHFPSSHSARLLPINNPSRFSPSGLNLKFLFVFLTWVLASGSNHSALSSRLLIKDCNICQLALFGITLGASPKKSQELTHKPDLGYLVLIKLHLPRAVLPPL